MKESTIDYRDIPVIIPSFEPDEKLMILVRRLQENGISNLILVDDGSGSEYSKLFEQAQRETNCILLTHSVNLGKGRALKTAFNYCLLHFPEQPGCITADSDGQHTPECILNCMAALNDTPEALILGCRDFDVQEVPFRSRFGNKLTCRIMGYLTGVRISDTQTGLRAIPASFMKRLMNVTGERFEFETNMLLEAKREEVAIREVKIKTVYIEENKTSHFRVVRDSLKIYMIFARFLFSSLSSSVLDLILFGISCKVLAGAGLDAMIYIPVATGTARIISATYNYLLNYKVVFHSKRSIKTTGSKYLILALFQAALSAILVNMIFPFIGGYEVLIKIPVDVLLFFLSFFIQRELVYR